MKFAQLSISLVMNATEFEFKDQSEAAEFAKLMQAAAVKNMKKVLNLPKEAEETAPIVPSFSIIGTPEGGDGSVGFNLGTIEGVWKTRKKKDSDDPSDDSSEDDDTEDETTEDKLLTEEEISDAVDEALENGDNDSDETVEAIVEAVTENKPSARVQVKPKNKK